MRERKNLLPVLLAGMLFGISVLAPATQATAPASDVPSVEALLQEAGFSSEERRHVLAGEIVRHEEVVDTSERELTVQMAFLIRKPPSEVVGEDIFGFGELEVLPAARIWSRLEDPVTEEDFSELQLTEFQDSLTEMYLHARPGDDLNLSESEIASFGMLRSSDETEWPKIEETFVQVLLERLRTYRQKGLSGVAPYQRRGGPFEPGKDLRRAVEAGTLLKNHMPEMYRTLLDYPSYKAPGIRERFAWIQFQLEDLPAVALVHQISLEIGTSAFVAAVRHFYVSRGYNSNEEHLGLFQVEEGSVVLYSDRLSLDRIAGMGSRVRHGLARKVMSRQLADLIERMRAAPSRDSR